MYIICLLLPFLGGFISRWHGGGFVSGSPKILKNAIWAVAFASSSIYALSLNTNLLAAILIGAIAGGVCLLGKASGHGGGMDLAHNSKEPGKGRKPEKVEYLILWLHGKINQYTYDAILLAMSGLFAVLGAVIAIGYYSPIAGIILALGGLSKSAAYMIGWGIDSEDLMEFGGKNFNEPTEIGEFLTGFFAFFGLSIALIIILNG